MIKKIKALWDSLNRGITVETITASPKTIEKFKEFLKEPVMEKVLKEELDKEYSFAGAKRGAVFKRVEPYKDSDLIGSNSAALNPYEHNYTKEQIGAENKAYYESRQRVPESLILITIMDKIKDALASPYPKKVVTLGIPLKVETKNTDEGRVLRHGLIAELFDKEAVDRNAVSALTGMGYIVTFLPWSQLYGDGSTYEYAMRIELK